MDEKVSSKALLLSIRPQLARRIFDGSKTVEIRRIRPSVCAGSVVLVYASSPVKALMGWFVVDRVLEAEPAQLWAEVQGISGISREQFDCYLKGSGRAFGIFVRDACELSDPIPLGRLREIWSGFHPPQCYRYVADREVRECCPAIGQYEAEIGVIRQ